MGALQLLYFATLSLDLNLSWSHCLRRRVQVNRDLEAFIEDARKAAVAVAAAAGTAGADEGSSARNGDVGSLDRIILIAERCLDEDVGAFRDSIQTIVDHVEVCVCVCGGGGGE